MIKFSRILYPEDYSCICCGNDVFDNPYFLCDECKKDLPFLSDRICLHCGEPLISDGLFCKRCKGKKFIFDRAVAPFEYSGHIVRFIKNLKYDGKKFYAKPIAKFMADCYLKNNFNCDIIIPVPLCDKRFKERGFNQSELIAESISQIINVDLKVDNLKRVKETPHQTNLDYMQRQVNLKDAFKVYNSKEIKDKSVLLIDDVYTTGATVRECSKVLKKAGAKFVFVITFAHTLIKEER